MWQGKEITQCGLSSPIWLHVFLCTFSACHPPIAATYSSSSFALESSRPAHSCFFCSLGAAGLLKVSSYVALVTSCLWASIPTHCALHIMPPRPPRGCCYCQRDFAVRLYNWVLLAWLVLVILAVGGLLVLSVSQAGLGAPAVKSIRI